ncbi:hypothetical protein GX50_08054 [[Emmonsia] crescens]|uniref:Uncharacterized protein n=1 Tax=[Emmonsia] crescens TaxID=73230 RepID=A0A2B7Z752_9EURO|nr:hypothetical protein GX50_08054 [Emmonsia crescens]
MEARSSDPDPMEIDHTVIGHKCDRHGFAEDSPFLTLEEWGVTHGDRIRYLQKLKDAEILCPNEYPNLDAAIAYHRQFPANDRYPDTVVTFENGRILKPGEQLTPFVPIWVEPAANDLPTPPTTLREIPANTPEPKQSSSAIYGWNKSRRMYQINIEIRIERSDGGHGASYSTHMFYDTGSTILSLSLADRDELGISTHDCRPLILHIANGQQVSATYVICQTRILNEKHQILVPWMTEKLAFFPHGEAHSSNMLLQQNNFVCSTPDSSVLYAAKTRFKLASLMF